MSGAENSEYRAVLDRVAAHFLTADGKVRRGGVINPYRAHHYQSEGAAKRHRATVLTLSQGIADVVYAFNRDLNVVLARGIKRMFAVSLAQYRRILDERSVLDFADVLDRALELLRRMDEFSQSRFRLEAALSARACRRVSRYEPRAMGTGGAPHPVMGRGQRRGEQPLDLRRRRSQTVDLPLP